MHGHQTVTYGLVVALTLVHAARTSAAASDRPANPAEIAGYWAALNDQNNEVAARALRWLAETDALDAASQNRLREFVRHPRMARLLEDQNRTVRLAAVKALSAPGIATKDQIPLLVALLKTPDADVRSEAARAVGALGTLAKDQAPHLVDLLRDPDLNVNSRAAHALGALGAKDQVPKIVALLKDTRWDVRRAAAKALGALGTLAKDQAPQLVDLLRDPDSKVSFAAAGALGTLGAKDQVTRIVNLLNDTNWNVRYAAVISLGALGAEDQASQLLPLLKDPDEDVRAAAATALGALGVLGKGEAPQLVALLKDPEADVRHAAIVALGALGALGKDEAPQLVTLLKDPDRRVRSEAVAAVIALGAVAKDEVPQVVTLLKDPYWQVSDAAAKALAARGGALAKEQVPQLVALLRDPDEDVSRAAAEVLGALGASAKDQVPHIGTFLKDPDGHVRLAAVRALGALGAVAKDEAPQLGALLKDPHPRIRLLAARALGALGASAEDQIPQLGDLLSDSYAGVRREAARALGAIGTLAKDQAPQLGALLKDPDGGVRAAAAEALGALGAFAKDHAPQIGALLRDPTWDVSDAARAALPKMAPLDPQLMIPVLALLNDDSGNRIDWLLFAHVCGGGNPKVELALQWLGRPIESERPTALSVDAVHATLDVFAEMWPLTEKHPALRADLANQIAIVVTMSQRYWKPDDLPRLMALEHSLRDAKSTHADTVQAVVNRVQVRNWLLNFGLGFSAHVGFWVLLLFVYPRSPQVQALFFWNPWVRKIAGLGYVGVCLALVPFARRRLMSPFARVLVADAELDRFSREAYFGRSEVLDHRTGKREFLLDAISRLTGQVVLEGDSGLGKSMFLRYLLRTSTRLAVYLPAERCKDGVLEAIQAKLEGQAKDATFLRSIIFSGAVDIYIDGLNEVTADTRAKIVQFTERNFHGHILLATQRIEWTPPQTARLYVLQPLSDAHILEFLVSREPILDEKSKLRGKDYALACERFVTAALGPDVPEELCRSIREILSNPMDLTVVAQMLADGISPDPFRLRQQQCEQMAEEYRKTHLADFPLKTFAEAVYQMRLNDDPLIPEEPFSRELMRLEAVKMVVRRQWRSPDGKDHREWRFRHDKIQEFFIAQTFLGEGNQRPNKHLNDPRFRGVYFLLAQILEPEKARQLQDTLVEYAAATRDHTVSDQFVNLFKERRNMEKARAASTRRRSAAEK